MKKFKITAMMSAMLMSLSSQALEINIKADSINYKPVVLGQMDEGLKNVVFNDLSKMNNLKIEKSTKKCNEIVKNLNTSYYCIDSKDNGTFYSLNVYEKYRDKSNNKNGVSIAYKNQNLSNYGHLFSNGLYKSIFGKESVFNSKLAFVERLDLKNGKNVFKLKIADYDGSNSKTLLSSPQPILAIDWSPDNNKIAYVSYETVRSSVFIQDLKTLKRKKIASFEGVNAFPSWSPNGKMLAMSLSKDGSSDLYIYYLDKNLLKKITKFKDTAAEPTWINNSEILFTYDKTGSPYLYKLNLSKGNVKPISKNYLYTTSAKIAENKKDAYSVYSKNRQTGILKTNINSRNERVLVNDFFAESPSVGKGSEIVIYSTKENNKNILKAVDQNGKKVYEIRTNNQLKEPSYSK